MDKSVVLLSGGMDSTVAYHWALKNTRVQEVVFFHFGQRNRLWEMYAYHEMVPPKMAHEIYLPQLWTVRDKPARNMVFISAATVRAGYNGASLIVGGWSAVDTPEYPDCSPAFLNLVGMAATAALGRAIIVTSPVLHLDKRRIVRLGDEYGVTWETTRSCYTESEEPCGECAACKHRREALEYHGHNFS